MGLWTYVVTRDHADENKEEYVFNIREYYFENVEDKFDASKKIGFTENPCYPQGETVLELLEDITMMSRAITSKVLDLTQDPPRFISIMEAMDTE